MIMFSIVLSGVISVSLLTPKEAKASLYNNLTDRPFMGWSSWSSIRKNPTEENIKTAADILAKKFKSHGYQYVNLDDFYQLDWTTTVDKYGRWAVDPGKFPHGMRALGDYIHKKGLKFGLYVTPGIPKGAVGQNTPIEGTHYHAKDIVDLNKGEEKNYNFEHMYYIDFSKPGAQEYIDSWAKLFASYGIDYLKIDGVGKQDIPDIKAWATALQKTGRPIHLELSNNLDIKSAKTWKKLSNGWRTSRDVESYGKDTITDWDHVSSRFAQAANWQQYAGPGGWNDFDSLNVANGDKDGLTKEEKRSYVSLWAIAASQFVIGSDLTKLDNYGISLLTNDEIIGANQSGIAGKRLFSSATAQVFYQKLPDGSYNVGLFNTGPSAQKLSIHWTDLGIHEPADVHDMWNHQNLGRRNSGFTVKLSVHGSRMIHVLPASTLTISPNSGEMGVNPTLVQLKWGVQSGADSYHVLMADDPGFKHIVNNLFVSLPTLTIDHLKTDKSYYWKVSSVTGGMEKQIGIYHFHTKMKTVPGSPDWITAERNDDHAVTLTWNPTFGTVTYTVYRKQVNSLGHSSPYSTIAANLTEPHFIDKTAIRHNGIKYSYFVTAKNELGESKRSFEAQTDNLLSAELAVPLILFLSVLIISIFFIINKNKYKYTQPV